MPNKGTGAGGSKTTKHGCSFEEKTKSENYLIEKKFVRNKIPEKSGKFDYFLLQEIATTKKIYLTQGALHLLTFQTPFILNLKNYVQSYL